MKKSIDWKNASDYPTDLTADEWRNEFLKRPKPAGDDAPPPKDAVIHMGRGVELHILLDAGCCLAEINLKRKIAPQLKKIEKAVFKWQRELISETKAGLVDSPDCLVLKNDAPPRNPEKLAAYLRALDGFNSSNKFVTVTFEEIWRTIYPQSKAHNPRSAGARLVDAACIMQEHFRNNTAFPIEHRLRIPPRPSSRCIWGDSSKQASE